MLEHFPFGVTSSDASGFLAALVDAFPDAAVLVSPKHVVERVNAAVEDALCVSSSELIGKPLSETPLGVEFGAGGVVHAPRKGGACITLRVTQRTLGRGGWRLLLLRPDVGAESDPEASVRAVPMASVRNCLAHELRSPLAAIVGFAELLTADVAAGDPDEARVLAGYLLGGARHLARLVDDFIDTTCLSRGRLHFTFATCDVEALIHESVALMQHEAELENVVIRAFISKPILATLDAMRFRQVLCNYLTVALKHALPGGLVRVSAGLDTAGFFRVEVAPSGPLGEPRSLASQVHAALSAPVPPATLGDSGALELETSRRLLEAQGGHAAIRMEPSGCALLALWPLHGATSGTRGTLPVFLQE